MSRFRITYAGKNNFIKEGKNAKYIQKDANGEIISDSTYKQPFLPGVGRSYIPSQRNGRIQIDMKQDELNALVKSLELYDKKGNLIESAPIGNPGAPFWSHEKMRIFLENSGTDIDDEDDIAKIWLAVFRADMKMRVGVSEDNPALDGVVKFDVVAAQDAVDSKNKDIDEVTNATDVLHNMDFDRQVRILRAMGVESRNPDPVAVKRSLMEKITIQKDSRMTNTGERMIEVFLRLAGTDNSEINIRGIITKAMRHARRVITKDKQKYYFGELPLGRNIEEVYQFLVKKENKDILDDISFKVGKDESLDD